MREQAGDLVATGFSEEHATQLAAIHRLDDLLQQRALQCGWRIGGLKYQSNVHHRRALSYHTASRCL